MKIHDLNCDTKFFRDLYELKKTHEVRLYDRDYQVGDFIVLNNYKDGSRINYLEGPGTVLHGVGTMTFCITHILTNEDFPDGLQPGYAVLSLRQAGGHEGRLARQLAADQQLLIKTAEEARSLALELAAAKDTIKALMQSETGVY